ncbi:MAG: tRNA (N6-isopentenyl adenosine(37)-C2)-methylthiotransferase MiaB [Kiritimatiellae bacterium]|nr:tRNA (N6-isopentenyl adenosine(37)-C2)-methylthiotransferase MiaB [Kiritimatiellia bacterium]
MKFIVHTYGCQMNVRDSEAVAALLAAAGHEKAANEDEAEMVIINSCTVRDKAEQKAIGKSGNMIAAKRNGSKRLVGLMGCAVKRLGEDVFKLLPGLDFAVGPRRFGAIPHLVERCLAGERRILETAGDDEVPQGLDAHEQQGFKAFVTVLLGCDNRCSYCIVPDVRGHEFSRPGREVAAEVGALAAHGVKEVCLLGQSVLRYGRRNAAWFASDPPSLYKEPFPRLLEMLDKTQGLERIRFTSAHPGGCTDELVQAFATMPRVCRHLHLPVQSGSDRILKAMGRGYARAEYLAAIAKLRRFDPEFALTTDVIVGYPGETEEDFEATRSLMEEAQFDNAFIFKYSPRPGTRSAALPDDVSKEEKERRNQVLLADQEKRGLARNERLVGTVREVMVEGPSLRNAARWSGRDGGNRIVVFAPPRALRPGETVQVRITEAHPQILIGEALA